jgi:hypothetical protein
MIMSDCEAEKPGKNYPQVICKINKLTGSMALVPILTQDFAILAWFSREARTSAKCSTQAFIRMFVETIGNINGSVGLLSS